MEKTALSKEIGKELSLVKSFIIGLAGRDREGNYRPEFVKKILTAVNDQQNHTFDDRESFLKKLSNLRND